MNLLERIFKVSQYLKDVEYSIQNQDLPLDPWNMEYLPELFVTSDNLNSQIARMIQSLKNGNSICSIYGDIRSGKSFLMNLLHDGLREDLWKYTDFDKISVLLFTPESIKEYSHTNFMQAIADSVLGKYYPTKEKVLVELKTHLEEKNKLLVLLIDNFQKEVLSSITRDTAKTLKALKKHLSCIITSNLVDEKNCKDGLKQGGLKHFSYYFHLSAFSMEEAKLLIQKQFAYSLNQSSVKATDFFTDRAINAAWMESKGNPWVLISILADSYTYSKEKGSKIVSHSDVTTAIDMFSRTPTHGGPVDHDKFMIQQALNNFPYRERQVCEYLMQRDASAKEITIYLYGELPSAEYRSKYMGTKSFLKRLKDKNVVIVTGQNGRSLTFGLNPKMKERITQNTDDGDSSSADKSKIAT